MDGELIDTEQGHGRCRVNRPESGAEHVEVLQGFVDICGIDVEPGDVGETHIGRAQDGLEVVEGKRDLAPHVFEVLWIAFGVDGRLARTNQLPVGSLKYFGLVVADIQ